MPVTPLSGRPRGVSWSPRYARQRPLSMHIRKYTTFGSAGFDAAHFIRPAKRGRVVEGARASSLRPSPATAIAGEGDRPAGAVEGAQDSTRRKRYGDIQTFSLSSLLLSRFFATRVFCDDNEAPRPAPPPPRYARSPSPATAGADI